tara:strand:- start:2712 stop:3008 length:297 start_codon:yes stop_codon:yes gene_type:complete
MLAWVAVVGESLTSRTSETIEPDALVPPPRQGFGIPDVVLRVAGFEAFVVEIVESTSLSSNKIDGADIESDKEHIISVIMMTRIFFDVALRRSDMLQT